MLQVKNKTKKFIAVLLAVFCTIAICSFLLHGIFPKKHYDTISKYTSIYNVDTDLVYALIKAESNFDENAVSSAGAKGLMQLTDKTFCYFIDKTGSDATVHDIFDAELNIHAGVWYISLLLDRYDGNIETAVAAYNAGPSNVDAWLKSYDYSADGKTLDSIPFEETRKHVETVIKYKKFYSGIYRG